MPPKPTPYKVIRLGFIIVIFITGCLAITFTQLFFSIIFLRNERLKKYGFNFTKKNFLILLTFVTGWCAPTKIYMSHDESIPINTFQKTNKRDHRLVHTFLDTRAIIMANHQIYTDWVFLWWCGYINNVADNVYIILKKSLRKIPILGYGMANYNFIFLSRKWETDKPQMSQQLLQLEHFTKTGNENKDLDLKKHWLIIFPEGTNMSDNRKEASDKYIAKIGTKPLNHVLLPRVRGLYFSTLRLSDTTKYMYDVTIGYAGHKPQEFAQDIFTLLGTYLHGKGPESVSLHFRAFEIGQIPNVVLDTSKTLTEEEDERNMEQFQSWIYDRWYEKDELMEKYYQTGSFVDEQSLYQTHLQLNTRLELLRVYIVPILLYVLIRFCVRLL